MQDETQVQMAKSTKLERMRLNVACFLLFFPAPRPPVPPTGAGAIRSVHTRSRQ